MAEQILYGTKEWAPHNFNFMCGCSNDCVYCYAKAMSIRFKRKTSDTWKIEETVPMMSKSYSKKDGPIMIPSSHDITPNNVDLAIEVMKKLLSNGNELLIVTKPNLDCIKKLTGSISQWKDMVKFRITIGSACTSTLKLWEPGAPSFEERLESLKFLFNSGYSTSISCEPMLDNDFDRLYAAVSSYVTDSIWIGKMNLPNSRVKANTSCSFPIGKLDELMNWQSDNNILALYEKYKHNPQIEWKESIKKVVNKYQRT